jgi:hypothetical protein
MARDLPRVAVQCCICGRFRGPDGHFASGEQPEGTLRTHVYCPRCAKEILDRLRSNGNGHGGGRAAASGAEDAAADGESGAGEADAGDGEDGPAGAGDIRSAIHPAPDHPEAPAASA